MTPDELRDRIAAERVEAVARALCAAAYHLERGSVWDRMGPQLQGDYRRLAVAALTADAEMVVSVADGLSPELTAAIFALGMAVDETSARYWHAQCARRGADQPMLARLWATWAEQNAPTVIRTDPRKEPRS